MVGNANWNRRRELEMEAQFPFIASEGYRLTSPDTIDYNCVAWAIDKDTETWWWPDAMGESYWPPNAPREETLDAFVAAFKLYGYEKCSSDSVEEGFQKIAIYVDSHKMPQHVARLDSETGKWLSKIGPAEDIEHDSLKGLFGGIPAYGEVSMYMKRKIQ